jgi:hypothetical protein
MSAGLVAVEDQFLILCIRHSRKLLPGSHAAPRIRSALHEAYLCGVSTCFAQLGAPLSPFKNGSTVCAISGAMNNS